MAQESSQSWVLGAVARFEAPLISYARRLLGGDLSRARDVVQETFLKLCRAGRNSVAEDKLAPWLYTVCRRAALDVRRKEMRMTLINEQVADAVPARAADPADIAESVDLGERVMGVVGRLPENQREAIVLKFGHGLSYKQIAEVMGQSVSNVGVLIHVGLKGVRERLGVVIQSSQ